MVLLAVGGATLLVGAISGGLAVSAKGDADELCPDKVCSPEGREAVDDASTKAMVSNVTLGIGAAAAVAGIVCLVVGANDDGEEAALRVVPSAGFDGAGAVVEGRF